MGALCGQAVRRVCPSPIRSPSTSRADGRRAQKGNRTPDLRITSALLYRLSYLGGTGRRPGRQSPGARARTARRKRIGSNRRVQPLIRARCGRSGRRALDQSCPNLGAAAQATMGCRHRRWRRRASLLTHRASASRLSPWRWRPILSALPSHRVSSRALTLVPSRRLMPSGVPRCRVRDSRGAGAS